MKPAVVLLLAALLAPMLAHARDDATEDAQRARIAAERGQVEAAFRAEEKACYQKFAVNDCVKDARARRRASMADLRRQEVSLNDAKRKRDAAEHVRALEDRAAAGRQQEAQRRQEAADAQLGRETHAVDKAATRASREASAPARAAARKQQAERRQAEAGAARTRRAQEAADNVKAHESRVAAARQRKAELEKRLAERKKPAAQPLPVPP